MKKRVWIVTMGLATLILFLVTPLFSSENDATLKIGNAAPHFKDRTLDGKELDLAKLHGKLVLVDFWGTWCPSCRTEIPHLKEAYKKFHKDGLEIISISVNDELNALKAFIKKNAMDWIQVFDQDGKLTDLYHVQYTPSPFLIDHTGKIVAMDEELMGDDLLPKIEQHLKKLPKQEKEQEKV